MTDWILSHEPALRLGSFGAVFAIMALWERVAERRELGQSRPRRWLANFALSVVDSLLVRLLFPAAAIGFTLLAERESWGLFNRVDLPVAVSVVLSVVALDFVLFLQHVMFHAVPALWRLHRVHHSDQDLDFTTGIRFHPLEILISLLVKFAAISVLGPPLVGVFLFEVLLNATSMFNHGNVRLGPALDRWLRRILVTPDMHRVHHSIAVDESNSNFGFNLPWWDRLLGTYRAQPRTGHERMRLGVEPLQRPEARNVVELLALPFTGSDGAGSRGGRDAPRLRDPEDSDDRARLGEGGGRNATSD